MAQAGRRTDPDIVERIAELKTQGFAPSAIRRSLEADERFSARTPALRTVQLLAKRVQASTGPAWQLTPETADEAPLVLRMITEVYTWSRGLITRLTVGQAEAAAAILRASPEIPIGHARRLMYELDRGRIGEGSLYAPGAIELYLALEPWTNPESATQEPGPGLLLLDHEIRRFADAHFEDEVAFISAFAQVQVDRLQRAHDASKDIAVRGVTRALAREHYGVELGASKEDSDDEAG
jgi:hypothetical protein